MWYGPQEVAQLRTDNDTLVRAKTVLELASAEQAKLNEVVVADFETKVKVPNLSRNLALPDMLWSRQIGETGGQFPGTLVQTRQVLE